MAPPPPKQVSKPRLPKASEEPARRPAVTRDAVQRVPAARPGEEAARGGDTRLHEVPEDDLAARGGDTRLHEIPEGELADLDDGPATPLQAPPPEPLPATRLEVLPSQQQTFEVTGEATIPASDFIEELRSRRPEPPPEKRPTTGSRDSLRSRSPEKEAAADAPQEGRPTTGSRQAARPKEPEPTQTETAIALPPGAQAEPPPTAKAEPQATETVNLPDDRTAAERRPEPAKKPASPAPPAQSGPNTLTLARLRSQVPRWVYAVLGGIALAVLAFSSTRWSGKLPKDFELRRAYPYGYEGAAGSQGERAPPAVEVTFTFQGKAECPATVEDPDPTCVRFGYGAAGFSGYMILRKTGAGWQRTSDEGMPFKLAR